MTIESINPKTLKQCRERASLSQQGLADVSKVSKKTIARIESGKSSANSNTVSRLAEALGVQPQDLSGQTGPDERARRLSEFCTLKAPIHLNTGLALQMVEKHYGISRRNQIAMAPLFAALLAEGSLAWRRRLHKEAEEAAGKLEEADHGHSLLMIAAGKAMDALDCEQESIEQRDIFGERVFELAEERWADPYPADPFTRYLQRLAEESGSELIRILPEARSRDDFDKHDDWMTSSQFAHSSVYYSIDPAELDRLAGDGRWARMALRRGHAPVADIPEHLLDDDASEERTAWLESKMPQDEREEVEAEDRNFLARFSHIRVSLDEVNEPEASSEDAGAREG